MVVDNSHKIQTYNLNIVGNAPAEYPTETLYGLLSFKEGDKEIEIQQLFPFRGEWGKPTQVRILNENELPFPKRLEIVWLSIVEKKFYILEQDLPSDFEEKWHAENIKCSDSIFEDFIIGMAPNAKIAIWFKGVKKSILAGWFEGKEIVVPMDIFLSEQPNISLKRYCENYCSILFPSDDIVKNLSSPSTVNCFEKRMKQYYYKFRILYAQWDKEKEQWQEYSEKDIIPIYDYVEANLIDGTFDKMHDESLLKMHKAAKPCNLRICWHIHKSEYEANFWFDEYGICEVFDRFYGVHTETKTDFIIHIDPIKKKYELSLYRYGLRKPVVIPENAYQLIAFKSGFENYRSDNYNQHTGAWIW